MNLSDQNGVIRHGDRLSGESGAHACGVILILAVLGMIATFVLACGTAQAGGLHTAFGTPGAMAGHEAQWRKYKQRFLKPDGRVIDTGNSGITHSESQGTGMLFATFAHDRADFHRIWTWTRANLGRGDGLYAWKFDPNNRANPVPDRNNATDGDLMIAWALLRAAKLWAEPDYTRQAEMTIRALETKVVENFAGWHILRPGEHGFDGYKTRTLNLSYCVFPALQEIAAHTRSPVWTNIYRNCLIFVTQAGFGSMSLPLDWVDIDTQGRVSPAKSKPVRFGYEAIRVPLYLIWAGHADAEFIERYNKAWSDYPLNQSPPSWIDPFTGKTAGYRGAKGFLAVRQLVSRALGRNVRSSLRYAQAKMPALGDWDDYYSASLVLFANLAQRPAGA